jgi:hypothetical protein
VNIKRELFGSAPFSNNEETAKAINLVSGSNAKETRRVFETKSIISAPTAKVGSKFISDGGINK